MVLSQCSRHCERSEASPSDLARDCPVALCAPRDDNGIRAQRPGMKIRFLRPTTMQSRESHAKESTMTAAIAQLYRYPVKGLSAEPLERVALAVGQCLPQDRRFAIALGPTAFDPAHPQWLAKTHFIMLMRDEELAHLRTSFDPQTSVLTVIEAGQVRLAAPLSEAEGCRRIA